MTIYKNPIKCPECGLDTRELYHATSRSNGQKVLMCDACYDNSDEGLHLPSGWLCERENELNDTE